MKKFFVCKSVDCKYAESNQDSQYGILRLRDSRECHYAKRHEYKHYQNYQSE